MFWIGNALRDDLAADVAASTVTVTLPQAVADQSQIKTDSRGAAAKTTIVDGRTVRFTAAPVNKGVGLEVKVTFPHGLVSATAPPWQGRFDAEQQRAAVGNLITVISAAFGFLILVGGAVGLYLLWYLRGRDRYAGLVADYLREPPSDLSPGVAGTLIDERADLQDVLATFTDLGRRGVLKIDEQQTPGPFGLGGSRDFVVTRLPHEEQLSNFERTLIDTIFIGGDDEVRLSQVKASVTNSLPRFGNELYAEVVARGYFERSPEATRARYKGFGGGADRPGLRRLDRPVNPLRRGRPRGDGDRDPPGADRGGADLPLPDHARQDPQGGRGIGEVERLQALSRQPGKVR